MLNEVRYRVNTRNKLNKDKISDSRLCKYSSYLNSGDNQKPEPDTKTIGKYLEFFKEEIRKDHETD